MRLLDLFCGGGGATKGYQRAGFYVVGVDIKPQPHYCGDEFVQADALEYVAEHGMKFDTIHASPPCQKFTAMQHIRKNSTRHLDLIEPVRALLEATNRPYIIENVNGAPLKAALMLCGTMFGLRIIRHRYFEAPWLPLVLLPPCDHRNVFDPWHGTTATGRSAAKFREAMGIDWMPQVGGPNKPGCLDLAIPPVYTEFIGRQLMKHLTWYECSEAISAEALEGMLL